MSKYMSKAMTKNMRLTFLFSVLLYMLGLANGLSILWLLKITPIAILFIAVLNTAASSNRNILLLALVFSGCGDLLLAFDHFVFGVAAFLLAQLSYAVIFSRYWQGISNRWPSSVLLLLVMLGMAAWLLPNLGNLQLPVIAYLLTIGTMGVLAFQSRLTWRWAVSGAVMFIISDSFIAVNKFIYPIPFEGYGIMTSYYAAQFMLVTGFINWMTQQKEI